jgi:hypothetical protein
MQQYHPAHRLPEITMSRSPDQPVDAAPLPRQASRRARGRMSVVPPGDPVPASAAAAPVLPDLIPVLLPDATAARRAVQSGATFAERLADLSMAAFADGQALARRWASETTEHLLLLARPPERPEDVMHVLSGFLAAQGDLATSQVGRALAIAQRVQVETIGLAAEAGHALAQEASDAVQRATGLRRGAD